MTINHHTPLSGADLLTLLISLNTRFSDLDSAITGLSSGASAGTASVTAVAGEGIADRSPVYINPSNGLVYVMDADASPIKAGAIRGFLSGTVLTSESATVVISGPLSGFSSLTAWNPVYAGTSAGSITQTRPSPTKGGVQINVAEMGFAYSATAIFVAPKPIFYMKRLAMDDDDTVEVNHHSDPNGYMRKITAYITETIPGAAVITYPSGNRDSDVLLNGQVPATYGSDLATSGQAIANGNFSTLVPGNAFDNNTSSQWYSNQIDGAGNNVSYIGQDFGGSPRHIRRVTLFMSAIYHQGWNIQYSDDNSAWTTILAVTDAVAGANTFDLPASGSHRYWRLLLTNYLPADAAYNRAGEIEMMEVATFSGGNTKLAQTITPGSALTVEGVTLNLKKVGAPSGTLTVRIETTSAGDATGTLVDANATATVSESGLSTSYTNVLFTFPATISLASGTQYAIVLSTSTGLSGINYVVWGADKSTPSYAGGEMKRFAGSWAAESADAIFDVNEPGTQYPSPVLIDWWSSGSADVVSRYGDESSDDLETKTTFKCVRDVGFDDLTVQVEVL